MYVDFARLGQYHNAKVGGYNQYVTVKIKRKILNIISPFPSVREEAKKSKNNATGDMILLSYGRQKKR